MKPKIKGITNTDDSYWFKLEAKDGTLKALDKIFDLNPYLNLHEGNNEIFSYSYKEHTAEDFSFHKETDDFLIYVIATKKGLNLILRKVKKAGEYKKKILEKFGFVK